jgi:VanZ family protein
MNWLRHLYSKRQRSYRYALWSCLIVIVILSLLPGEIRPQTGAPGELEHFIAYLGAGLFIAARYRLPRLRLISWAATATLSCILEFLQQFVPGRVPDPYDALASSSGLTLGILTGSVLFGGGSWLARIIRRVCGDEAAKEIGEDRGRLQLHRARRTCR